MTTKNTAIDDEDDDDLHDEDGSAKGGDGKKDDEQALAEAGGEFVEIDLTEPEKKGKDQEGADDHAGDSRLDVESQAGANAEETVEERRERRRKEKKQRALNAKRAREHKDRELAELRQRNQDLEERVNGIGQQLSTQDRNQLVNRAKILQSQIAEATKLIATAVAAGNGEAMAKAMEVRDDSVYELRQIQQVAERANAQAHQQRRQAPTAPRVDPVVQGHIARFTSAHPWYDVKGVDEDSAIVVAIDKAVAQAGFDPRTQDYWDELEKRLRKRLPERFEDDEDDQGEGQPVRRAAGGKAPAGNGRRGPPTASGRGSTVSGGKMRMYVSPERKKALIEAGHWDDPAMRRKMLLKYAAYDREHSQQG